MMKLIEQIIGKTVTKVTADDIYGATQIAPGVFYKCTKLTSIEFPETVEKIGRDRDNATFPFIGCTALSSVDTSKLPETCDFFWKAFQDTPWLKSFPNGMNLLCDGKILFYPKNVTTAAIPASVRTIPYGTLDEVAAATIVVPDTVVRIYGNAFGNSATTKVVIGAGVQVMGIGTMENTKVTTWICRQPADMVIDMPAEAGRYKGLAYNKNSRSFTLYTDNKMLKAYNWAGDNVTATIKPLSEAPA